MEAQHSFRATTLMGGKVPCEVCDLEQRWVSPFAPPVCTVCIQRTFACPVRTPYVTSLSCFRPFEFSRFLLIGSLPNRERGERESGKKKTVDFSPAIVRSAESG